MATKYFIFGAAFNGDGTSSSEAASDGAAGAWSQESILTGTAPTYGSLAAGDFVEIRSKTGNGANADISKTLSTATFGNSAGTAAAPITWRLDDGTVWSGVSGTLTYTTSGTTVVATLRQHNRFVSRVAGNWIFQWTATSPGSVPCIWAGIVDGLKFDFAARTASTSVSIRCDNGGTYFRPRIVFGRTGTSGGILVANNCRVRLIDPDIELQSAANVGGGIFGQSGFFGHFHVRGGQMHGSGATTGVPLVKGPSSTNSMVFDSVGFQVPKAMDAASLAAGNSIATLMGLDGGSGGAVATYGGTADSRNIDSYYPTLNATLPDSGSSGVSWRLAPSTVCSNDTPLMLTIAELYADTAAAVTLTQELLIATGWTGTAPDKSNVWMEVSYIDDSTGLPVHQTTRVLDGGSLDTSTASWSATTWGAVGLAKYKLAITTASDVAQDTAITVALFTTAASGSSNDIMIACPAPQLT